MSNETATQPKTRRRFRAFRHHKQRFDPAADFIWRKALLLGDGPNKTVPGETVDKSIEKKKPGFLRRLWRNHLIELKDWKPRERRKPQPKQTKLGLSVREGRYKLIATEEGGDPHRYRQNGLGNLLKIAVSIGCEDRVRALVETIKGNPDCNAAAEIDDGHGIVACIVDPETERWKVLEVDCDTDTSDEGGLDAEAGADQSANGESGEGASGDPDGGGGEGVSAPADSPEGQDGAPEGDPEDQEDAPDAQDGDGDESTTEVTGEDADAQEEQEGTPEEGADPDAETPATGEHETTADSEEAAEGTTEDSEPDETPAE